MHTNKRILAFLVVFTMLCGMMVINTGVNAANEFSSKTVHADATYTLDAAYTGTVTVEFDFTPQSNARAGEIGFASSTTNVTGWGNLPMIIRFTATSATDTPFPGAFDARNGDGYDGATSVAWEKNKKHHIKLVSTLSSKKYSVWVTPEGGTETQIAKDFNFRSSAGSMADLGKITVMGKSDGDALISNFTASGGAAGSVSTPSTPAPTSPSTASSISGDLMAKAAFESAGYSLGNRYTGNVTVEFDATPITAKNMEIGLTAAEANVTGYGNLAMIVRFQKQSDTGAIDAYDGSGYSALTTLKWVRETTYHVKVQSEITSKKYSVWVTSPDGTETQIVNNAAYRNGAAPVVNVGKIYVKGVADGDLKVSNVKVSGTASSVATPTPTATAKPQPVTTEPPTTFSADITNHANRNALEVLAALRVLPSGTFNPDETLTRGAFASLLARAMGHPDADKSMNEQIFKDVPSTHPYVGSICFAYGLGIISPNEADMFYPDEPIKFEQAVKMIVVALGYDLYAKDRGAYPVGYINIGGEKGITKSVSASIDTPLTKALAAQMLFNALEVDLMKSVAFGVTSEYAITKGENMLTELLGMEKQKGQVVTNSRTKLTGIGNVRLHEVEIKVDNQPVRYDIGYTDAADMLGYPVVFYAKVDEDNDQKTLVYIKKDTSKIDSVTVKADDISGDSPQFSLDKFVYEDADGNKEELKIADQPKVIFNGVAYNAYTLNDFRPASGEVTLISTEGDDIYDIILITSYVNYVVDRTSTDNFIVSDKYAMPNLELDPDTNAYDVEIYKGGSRVPFTALANWDVLSVAVSKTPGGKVFKKVMVSTDKISGTITEINATDDSYLINGVEYKKAANLANKTLQNNDTGTFYLDIEGKIAGVDTTADSGRKYGFLFAHAVQKGVAGRVQFKLFTDQDKFVTFVSAEKISLNGAPRVKASDVSTNSAIYDIATTSTKRQLIRYKTNASGEITDIDVASVTMGDPTSTSVIYDKARRDADLSMIEDDVFRIAAPFAARNNRKFPGGATINGYHVGSSASTPLRFFYGPQTIVFKVPVVSAVATSAYSDDEDRYSVYPANNKANNRNSYVESYDADIGGLVKVIVERYSISENPDIDYSDTMKVIESVSDTIDDEGNIVKKVNYYDDGVLVSKVVPNGITPTLKLNPAAGYAYLDNNKVKVDNVPKTTPVLYVPPTYSLKAGDIIAISTNSKDNIDGMEVIFSDASGIRLAATNNNNSTEQVVSGKVRYLDNTDFVTLDTGLPVSDARSYFKFVLQAATKYYTYDFETEVVKSASAADMAVNDMVVVRLASSRTMEVIIIKNSSHEWGLADTL